MIYSMTGFARREKSLDEGTLIWEIRSVNHRFLEIMVRLPEEMRGLDPLVRRTVGSQIKRGKVDCTLRLEPAANRDTPLRVNERLVNQLIDAAAQVEQMLHETMPLRTMDVLSWPGVLESPSDELSDLQQMAGELLKEALTELKVGRGEEGKNLARLIGERCTSMHALVARARERMPLVLEGIRGRLRERLAEVNAELDPARLEQELALLAQRLDVDEEMDRLANHITEVENTLRRKEPVGRRLDFLMQELNREANTLGSKSSDLELTRIAVEMKVAIEQMREQIQNCE
jgi:uncharacterized protein (TIGR00255 family)